MRSEPAVAAYIANYPIEVRRALKRVRAILRKALPKAEEVISYGMPAYRVNGKTAIYFGGFKNHYSIYAKGHGAMKFPLDEPVPAKLIERIARSYVVPSKRLKKLR